MGKCSYTWKEWDKEQGRIERSCPHDTWEGSDEFCIFHDPSPYKDRDLFIEKLKEQMESEKEKYSFIGYVFPEDWDYFKNYEFKISVDLREATFHDADFRRAIFEEVYFRSATFENVNFWGATFQDANFFKATFQKDADFNETKFHGNANFIYSIFQGNANFSKATFQGNAYFIYTTFQNANFGETIFQGDTYFNYATFQKDAQFIYAAFQNLSMIGTIFRENLDFNAKQAKIFDLRNTKFFFMGTIIADLKMARFHTSSLKNVSFVGCQWLNDKKIYEEDHMNDENLSYKELETIYRNLKQNMQRHGDYSAVGEFYYREMEMRRKKNNWKSKNRWWLELYRFIAGYGEKPQLVIRNSFLIIFITALFFFYNGIIRTNIFPLLEKTPYIIDYSLHSINFNMQVLTDFGYCLYYSIVTFTTLGYGDIHPLGFSHVIASIEAIIGAFFMALFVVVFVRKMAR